MKLRVFVIEAGAEKINGSFPGKYTLSKYIG